MAKESDRGCVLVGASLLDYMLEKIIRRTLLPDAKGTKKKVINSLFEINGPFSSFWSKTQFLYGIGIIKEDFYSDLEIIRKIRNIVAHNFDVVSFSDKRIADKTEKLKASDEAVKHLPKSKSKKMKIAKTKNTQNTKTIDKAVMEMMRFSMSASYIGGYLEVFTSDIGALVLPLRLMKDAEKQILNSI